MLEAINCYFNCIMQSNTRFILFLILVITLLLGTLFMITKRPRHMFFSQIASSVAIIEGFRQMTCPMVGLVWTYFGIIFGVFVILGVVQAVFDKYVRDLEIGDTHLMRGMSREFSTEIFLLDTQKIKAFAHRRRIYLSVGLMELLEPDEIRAVAAHELYHAKHTPNRFMANVLAVSSLWFKSYRDDAKADMFAAEMVGRGPLIGGLQKLGVKGIERRMARLGA
ncbi:MAG: M48 family metalloprotease [Thermoplasmata archaeon]|nr:MAG: M48 family metalloprotease [Thermoplasmata archaeon]